MSDKKSRVSKRWWLKKIGFRHWELRYAQERTVFETFRCGITAIQFRTMLNRHDINPTPWPH